MCVDDHRFWRYVENAQPNYANAERYGWGLDTPWPERREAVHAKELAELHDPESELARYVWDPYDLWELERRAAATARAVAAKVATQLTLWP